MLHKYPTVPGPAGRLIWPATALTEEEIPSRGSFVTAKVIGRDYPMQGILDGPVIRIEGGGVARWVEVFVEVKDADILPGTLPGVLAWRRQNLAGGEEGA